MLLPRTHTHNIHQLIVNHIDEKAIHFYLPLLCPSSVTASNVGGFLGGGGASSRVNKEADRVRSRVRQLIDGLKPSASHARRGADVGPLTDRRPFSTTSLSAPLGSLTTTTLGVNTRHLQLTRQLTVSRLRFH